MIESRFDGCLLSLESESIVVYGGGRSSSSNVQLLSSVELVSFKDLANVSASLSATMLSVERARSGCAAVNSTSVIFVGGWTLDSQSKQVVATDVVDLIDVAASNARVVSSRLSRKVVAPSVASLSGVVIVTGGQKTDSDNSVFVDAFDYGSVLNDAVERYDIVNQQWQYIANALTMFTDQSQLVQRVAFPFANRVRLSANIFCDREITILTPNGKFIAVVGAQSTIAYERSLHPVSRWSCFFFFL